MESKLFTIHAVLAGAYKGKSVSKRPLLNHASIDGGITALCKKVKQDSLCDVEEAIDSLDCPVCLARVAKL